MINPFNSNLKKFQKDEFLKAASRIIESGQFILGKHNEALEQGLSDLLHGANVVCVSSGTVALECVFDYYIRFGNLKRVAVQSNTNFATVSSVLRAGGEVVFIDCDESGQLDLSDLALKNKKYDFDIVVAVHIGGYISKSINLIEDFCKKNNQIFVEDCAHAHGSSFMGRPAGTFGDCSIFSFFPTKVINGSEGGSINTRNTDLTEFARKWRNQGKGGVYGNDHAILGGSYRMPEFNALLATLSLENLNAEIEFRKNNALVIADGIKAFDVVDPSYMDCFSGYKLIVSSSAHSGQCLEKYLASHNIICGGAVYRTPCHRQPVFKDEKAGTEHLPGTDLFCERHFCPPLHSGLKEYQVLQIIDTLNDFNAQY